MKTQTKPCPNVLPCVLVLLSATLVSAGPLDNWQPRAIGASNGITALAYGAGRFVAVDEGDGGESFLLISPNGEDWIRQNTGTNLSATGLAVGQDIMWAATWGEWLWRSTNGSNWVANGPGLRFVSYGDGIFAVVGSQYGICIPSPCPLEPTLWRSTNGIYWQQTGFGDQGQGVIVRGHFARGKGISALLAKFVPKSLITFPPPPQITRILVWSSTNEVNWTSTELQSWGTTPSDLIPSPWMGMAFGNNMFFAVLSTSSIYTSTDGVTWTIQQPLTNTFLYDVTFGAGHFVVVGSGGTILTSPDGIDWTIRDSGTTSNLFNVRFGDQTFLASGSGATVWQCDLRIRLNIAFSPAPQLTISGPTGTVYQIEAVAGLNPTDSWQVLTNIAIPFSPYTWTDSGGLAKSARYYRAVMLLP